MAIVQLYQDQHLLAYLKPPLMHSVPGENPESFVELIKSNFKLNDFNKGHPEAGIINRLDYETSGIILAAKSKEVFDKLKIYTKQNLIQKNYVFLSDKTIDRKTACELSIGSRNRKSNFVRAKLVARNKDRLTPARTVFDKIASTSDLSLNLLEATIYQGQRHQIRVHAKEIRCPLINDSKYGGTVHQEVPNIIFILHNIRCEFNHPVTDKLTVIWADFDAKVLEFIKKFNWVFDYKSNNLEQNINIQEYIRSKLL